MERIKNRVRIMLNLVHEIGLKETATFFAEGIGIGPYVTAVCGGDGAIRGATDSNVLGFDGFKIITIAADFDIDVIDGHMNLPKGNISARG